MCGVGDGPPAPAREVSITRDRRAEATVKDIEAPLHPSPSLRDHGGTGPRDLSNVRSPGRRCRYTRVTRLCEAFVTYLDSPPTEFPVLGSDNLTHSSRDQGTGSPCVRCQRPTCPTPQRQEVSSESPSLGEPSSWRTRDPVSCL